MKHEVRLTLLELNRLVREVIECEMRSEYWVEAELSECRESRGHCYMELIQKDERTSTPVAKASAKCWASKWMIVRPYFERITGQRLSAGMKVLLKVYPQFHEAFGFSWIVTDIDPTYTMGDMARKRQEIIRQLKEEGVFNLQKELQLPFFCQHIAVISSETAAGYGDFCNQLADNPYGFQFRTQLFPAIMQGEGTSQSIITALERIFDAPSTMHNAQFDCVVIIRGGGATSDMSGFDTLELAENVANFPIPIITGIGHERDESILDMVSHTRVKTPTAAAAFLISHLKEVADAVNEAENTIVRRVQDRMQMEQIRLNRIAEAIPRLFSVVKTRQEAQIDAMFYRMVAKIQQGIISNRASIDTLEQRIPMLIERRITSERHRLQLIEEKTKSLDPTLLLRRGFSITLHQGKAVKDPQTLKPGDEIETRLEKGTIKSTIKSV
ncbi:MAG: exodeoxyribonuclease VII large subunit [Prevotella sp.]|nr:exodeoxyribonuclease VII large subunit [Prevotella sp.]